MYNFHLNKYEDYKTTLFRIQVKFSEKYYIISIFHENKIKYCFFI